MIAVREAKIDDVPGIRDVFQVEYGDYYAYPEYYDTESLTRLVYADASILLVAVDTESQRVAGTASVVFSVGAQNDLVGEFGRLVVHPDFRGRGIGKLLMDGRIQRVQSRLHVGIVENRASHSYSQKISERFGFVPVGFAPMKLLLQRREAIAFYVRHFGDALALRRNNPRVIPEASPLAGLALEHCGLPQDAIIDDASAPFSSGDDFQLDVLETEGYAALLRIERGRIRNRDIFGPIRLHYGMFQLRASHSHYLIARRDKQIAGGVGFMIDDAEKAVRIFELISLVDAPIRCLLTELVRKCKQELGVEYIEVDVSAYSPRMQRTLLELGFLPVSYTPANVFHEVERLDAIKMACLLVPFDLGPVEFCDAVRPIADVVTRSFTSKEVLPQIAQASRQSPLFAGLNDEQRNCLLRICTPQSFSPDNCIYQHGQTDGTMHLILRGTVQLFASDGDHFAEVSAGQCLGESSLLDSEGKALPHTVTANAKTQVETAAFTNSEFSELIRRRPDIGVVIYRNLACDISKKLKDADHQTFQSGSPLANLRVY